MSVELQIVFDGEEPGLAEHRLSLASFGEPLRLLLAALQRTASGMLADAVGDPAYGSRGGKLAADAKLLDLELATIDTGCAAPKFVCKARPGQQVVIDVVDTLSERALERLVRDIGAESSGRAVNAMARKYLASVPKGVRRQRYAAFSDGKLLCEAEFGSPSLPTITTAPPRLVKVTGRIVGAGFEPGASYISIKFSGRTLRCTATLDQIDRALQLRHAEIVAAVFDGPKASLVWLRDAANVVVPPPIESTIEQLRTKWSETLRILAQ